MTGSSVSPSIRFDALCAEIERCMLEHRVPGVAVGLLHRDAAYTAGLGITNVDHPLLVTDETLFQIGSITKTFTGTLVMALVEEGVLDLDAPVRTYLPDFALADDESAGRATIRHLLTHTGGWVGDHFIDTGEGHDASARYVADMAKLPQLVPLGRFYSYNNSGFYLLGHLLETILGQSYEETLRRRILDPLGLAHAYLKPTDVMTRRFATGHRVENEQAVVATPWPLPRAVQAVGGLITGVKELLHYARFQLGDGTAPGGARILSAASLAAMHSPQVAVWGEQEAVGLSWFLSWRDGVKAISHSGGTVGQISLLTVIPEHEFAITLLTNGERGGAVNLAAYRWTLEHVLGIKPAVPQPVAAPAERLSEFVGTYTRPMADLTLTLDGEELLLQLTPKLGFPTAEAPVPPPPPPMPVALCSEPDRLLVTGGFLRDSLIDVLRDDTGAIHYLRMSRLFTRQET